MWFKLAGATFTNNLGTMDSISKSYMMDYSGLTGLQASPGSVSYATDSTPDATITFTVKSGYVFKSGSTVTASGGASKTYTASADIAAGSSFTMALTGINNKVTFTGAAELVSGGGSSSGGGGSEGGGDTTDPIPDGTLITSGSLTGAYLYENRKFIGTAIGSYTGHEADTTNTYFVYDKIPVIAERNITITKGRAFYYSDSSGKVLTTNQGNLTSGATNYTVTVPSGAAYISVAFKYADIQPSAVTMTMSAALTVESETLISTLTTTYEDEKGYGATSATVMVEATGYFGYGDIPVTGGRYYKIPYARYTYILDSNKNAIQSLNLAKDVADWTYQMPSNAAYVNTTFKKADGVTVDTAKLILMKEG